MNNLPQTKTEAKARYLTEQLEKTIEVYKSASRTERSAAIKHIDSFLETLPEDQKTFWLKFRCRLERMNEFALPMHPDAFNTIYLGGNSVFPQ